jgi:hypothetical protein
MFNKNKCGNNAGIVAQQKWAKKRVEYLNSLPKQQGLFQDEDKYLYCFLLTIYPFEPHSYMRLEILHQIRASLQEM